MLYLIGMGINDEKDISIKSIEILRSCDVVYCETFTNNWSGSIKNIEEMTGKEIIMLKREDVEQRFPLNDCRNSNIALLVPGDPLIATTHFQLVAEAKKSNIKYEVIHSSSIFTAISETGVYTYKFGRVTTIPFPADNYNPKSPFDIISLNKKIGLHTLVLLDIGMTAMQGIKILCENGFEDEKILACCRLGSSEKVIKYGTAKEMKYDNDLNATPAAIIVVSELNFDEEEALSLWK